MRQTKPKLAKVGWLFAAIAVVGMTFALTACGDKKDSSKATTKRRTYPGGCKNCNYTDLLASGLGNTSDQSAIQVALDFYADDYYYSNNNNPYEQNYYDSYYGGGSYSGSVAAEGRMFVYNGRLNGCTIPDGDYVVRTYSPGQWTNTGPKGILLEAEKGGVLIRMKLIYGYLFQAHPQLSSCNGELYSSELMGQIDIESVEDGHGAYCTNRSAAIYLNSNYNVCY